MYNTISSCVYHYKVIMAQDNEIYENIEVEDYTSLETTATKETTATVISMGDGGAKVVHMTKAKSPKWIIVIHVVLALWSASLTGVIIWNNIKPSTSETAICENFFCGNGGSCSIQDNSPKCICPVGHTGKHCEINLEKTTLDACEKFPCANEGICIVKNQTPQCICPTGFTGDLCQINLSQLCTYHTCLNGGICTVKDDTDKALCVCPQGYSGDYCETGHNQSMVVAFTAKLSALFAQRPGVNQIVPYDNITLNIGNGFDGGSHKFTAPVSGIYMFTFCAFSEGVNGVIRVHLMLNGHISTTVYAAYGGYDSACNTELFNLSAGDVVHVELIGRDSTKGLIDNTSNYNTFSGYLIADLKH